MTETEQPDTPPLTRKQLRELRNTGTTPVITAEEPEEGFDAESAESPSEPPVPIPAPLPRAAEPPVVDPAPPADATVDLGVAPLTRRQARQQERIRTASVPVITPEVEALHRAGAMTAEQPSPAPIDSVPGPHEADSEDAVEEPGGAAVEAEPIVVEPIATAQDPEDSEYERRAVINPALGEGILAREPVEIDLPPSFDQLLARGSTGSVGMPNALILSQTTGDLPIVAPITATGEVIVTGTFNLPEGLGSTGHALGTADGKEVDAVLLDGELPAHSSPTPISASAAISTVKSAGEVIKPPAPEKGGRLMLWLAITAGALALALVGVLILAIVNGVF